MEIIHTAPSSRIWINLTEETLEITRQVGKKDKNLLPLATAYLCDSVISEYGSTKIEYWDKRNCTTGIIIKIQILILSVEVLGSFPQANWFYM